MKGKLIFILLAAAIFESTIVPFPLTLLVISVYALNFGGNAAIWAFAGGLFLDYFSFRSLGLTSLFFLCICWVVERYQKKLHIGSVAYFIIFFAVLSAIYGFLFYKYITVIAIVQSIILGSILLATVSTMARNSSESKKRIKV